MKEATTFLPLEALEPHTGLITATQASRLKYDIEMTAFRTWLDVHGTGNGASKWMDDAGLDKAIKNLVETINGGYEQDKAEYLY